VGTSHKTLECLALSHCVFTAGGERVKISLFSVTLFLFRCSHKFLLFVDHPKTLDNFFLWHNLLSSASGEQSCLPIFDYKGHLPLFDGSLFDEIQLCFYSVMLSLCVADRERDITRFSCNLMFIWSYTILYQRVTIVDSVMAWAKELPMLEHTHIGRRSNIHTETHTPLGRRTNTYTQRHTHLGRRTNTYTQRQTHTQWQTHTPRQAHQRIHTEAHTHTPLGRRTNTYPQRHTHTHLGRRTNTYRGSHTDLGRCS
jgi:hypothetical protein